MKKLESSSKVWFHETNGGDGFYFCQNVERVGKVIPIEEALKDTSWWSKPKEMHKFYAQEFGNAIFTTEQVDRTDGGDLPAGRYVHQKRHDSGLPERLEVIDGREDTFLNIRKNLDFVKEDIKAFLANKDTYKELGMSYRRGYLLYGPPGNGKTAQIRELARSVLKDTIVVWLSHLPSVEMRIALSKSPLLKVFIIEEITGHNNNSYEIKNLLDFFDGETSVDNSITIGTTNYPSYLQANLVDRPSRFDVVQEIPNLSPVEAHMYIEKFLNRQVRFDEMEWTEMSVAHVKEIALKHRVTKKSLQECYDEMMDTKEKIKKGFPEKEKQNGIGFAAKSNSGTDLSELKRVLDERLKL